MEIKYDSVYYSYYEGTERENIVLEDININIMELLEKQVLEKLHF